jgi:hypothetical protein
MRSAAFTLAALLAFTSPAAAADETPAASKIVGVDLFKNGLAVVNREVTLGKAGTYALDDVPHPVHGTFWVESAGPVEAAVKFRDVAVPAAEAPPGNPQEDFAGKVVTIHFKGDKRTPATGTMMKLKPAKGEDATSARYIVLQNGTTRRYIDPAEVGTIDVEDAGDTVTRRRPRLLLTLGKTDKPETKVTVRYLAHGLSWAPSYKVDITDPKALAVEQHAVVRNELADLVGAEVRLISGYPSVEYAHARSPLSPRTSWAAFFTQLSGGGGRFADATMNSIVAQQPAGNFRGVFDLALGATPAGEGVDLHYQPVGKRTLAEGDALALTVAAAKADYERIVEWQVADNRDEHGRPGRREGTEPDDAWDALKFKNPFPFPMTTGPATVTADGKFNGQRTCYWANAGEETVLRVGKALSVRTRAAENERLAKDGGRREVVWVGGREYRRATVEGELAVGNHRKEAVKVVVRRRLSGDVVSAEGDPRVTLREEGVFSVNKRNELLWTVSLKPGEERTLKYTFTVLVPN